MEISDVPGPGASFPEIWRFAAAFDGHAYAGDHKTLVKQSRAMARDWNPNRSFEGHTLRDLRAALYWRRSVARTQATDPEDPTAQFVRDLARTVTSPH